MSFTTTTLAPIFSLTAVSMSCIVIRNSPSPMTATTSFSGDAIFAASAAGKTKPMEPMFVAARNERLDLTLTKA